jgi:hypothetical protein
MIGQLNRKIKVSYPTFGIDSAGGQFVDDVTEWEQMASVETTRGNGNDSEAMNVWTYDVKFTMRVLLTIKSNYTLEYMGDKYAINSIKVTNERKKQFYEIIATKVDGNI